MVVVVLVVVVVVVVVAAAVPLRHFYQWMLGTLSPKVKWRQSRHSAHRMPRLDTRGVSHPLPIRLHRAVLKVQGNDY